MKTFDLAVKYLSQAGIDFSKYDIYGGGKTPDSQLILLQIKQPHTNYKADKENNVSNDYYKDVVFESALSHLVQLAHEKTSWFNKASEIIWKKKAELKDKGNYIPVWTNRVQQKKSLCNHPKKQKS